MVLGDGLDVGLASTEGVAVTVETLSTATGGFDVPVAPRTPIPAINSTNAPKRVKPASFLLASQIHSPRPNSIAKNAKTAAKMANNIRNPPNPPPSPKSENSKTSPKTIHGVRDFLLPS